MRGWTLVVSGALLGLSISAFPARAQFFDDEEGWPIFSFHRYGGDVNRPASTPDRPYWHGDDAVPLSLRWRDPEAAVDEVAVGVPPVQATYGVAAGAVVAVAVSGPPHAHHVVHHRRAKVVRAKNDCIPVVAKTEKTAVSPVGQLEPRKPEQSKTP